MEEERFWLLPWPQPIASVTWDPLVLGSQARSSLSASLPFFYPQSGQVQILSPCFHLSLLTMEGVDIQPSVLHLLPPFPCVSNVEVRLWWLEGQQSPGLLPGAVHRPRRMWPKSRAPWGCEVGQFYLHFT